ncbi:hypothetical protein BJV74DRAFT_783291 [Russula compacta]|nr:hypothetical protein BJV74DRAFT_783291 [Russula compacta]
MVKAAKSYNVNFVALWLSQCLKEKLPAWFLTNSVHHLVNNRAVRCLIHKHKSMTIVDPMRTSACVRNEENPPQHQTTNFCCCHLCIDDNNNNCTHPNDCAKEALERLRKITPKVNPLHTVALGKNLSLME